MNHDSFIVDLGTFHNSVDFTDKTVQHFVEKITDRFISNDNNHKLQLKFNSIQNIEREMLKN